MQSPSANGAVIGPAEAIRWPLLGSLVIGGYPAFANGPQMSNDPCQYRTVAHNSYRTFRPHPPVAEAIAVDNRPTPERTPDA